MALKKEKVSATSGKKKGQCLKGDQCSFRHESNDCAQQKPNPNAATPSEPSLSRGRSVSRKSSIKGKSNHGPILRQPWRYYLKGTCTRSPCEYWHPPECQFYENESGCKAGDKCLFPHHKVDETPNRKPKKATIPKMAEKATTRMQWLLWKLYHKWVVHHKIQMHSFLKVDKSFGETQCRKSWTQFEKFDSLSPRYVKRVSGKRTDHRWEKQKSFFVSEVPSLQNSRIGPTKSPRRDWKTRAVCPKQCFGSYQKFVQA